MSISDATATRTIRLSASTPVTELAVVDADHRLVAHGLGELEVEVPPGIYRIESRCGPAIESRLVTVIDSDIEETGIELRLPSPAPVVGTTTTTSAHEGCAEEASAALREAAVDGSGLVVLVRTPDGSPLSAEGVGEVALLDGARRRVEVPVWRRSEDGSCLWWAVPLRADGYVLRGPHAAATELVAEQPLRICDGWQTLLFAWASGGRAIFTEASIHMAPGAYGWTADDVNHIRLEAALSDVVAGRPFSAELALDAARSGALATNPMLAIAVGNSLATPPEGEVATMLDELRERMHDHPDVRILPWRLAELAANVNFRQAEPERGPLFDWPPMLVSGFRALQRLDALGKGAIRAGTLAEHAASLAVHDGIWTVWDASAGPAAAAGSGAPDFGLPDGAWDPATRRIAHHLDRVAALQESPSRAELLKRDPDAIALATGLATSTVAKALTDLEVAVRSETEREALAEEPAGPGEVAAPPAEPTSAEPSPDEPPSAEFAPSERPLIPSERRLRVLSRVGAALAVLVALAWIATLASEATSRAMAVGLVTENLLIAFLLGVTAGDVRRFPALMSGVAGILILSGILGLVAGASDPGTTVQIVGFKLDERWFLIGNGVTQLVVGGVMAIAGAAAQADRWGLDVLSAGHRRTLSALGDAYSPEGSRVTGDDVADHVDRYLTGLDAGRHGRVRLALGTVALLPVLSLHGTLSLLGAEERRAFLHKLTHRARRHPAELGPPAIAVAHQLVGLGYYADTRVVHEILGPRLADEEHAAKAPPRPVLNVEDPAGFDEGTPSADVVVIGSGLTGALLAYRIAERGRSVLVLERGSHVQAPAEKAETLSDLYRDGGLHVVRHFNDRYVRVMGVGGSCLLSDPEFSMVPEPVIDRWNESDLESGLDPQQFEEALARVKQLLPGVTMPSGELNPGARRLLDGLQEIQVPVADGHDRMRDGPGPAELSARSQSVVDTLLPWGQKRFGDGLRLVPDCRIDRVLTDEGRATGVRCRLRNGRRLIVPAEAVILAAGAVESSAVLRASRLGGRRVGRNVSATMSSGVVAEFRELLDADRGVQLGVYAGERPSGFVLTTDWEPLPLQAMLMPGWFGEHAANMRRYRYMTSGSALVSINGRAEVKHGVCTAKPSAADLERLSDRLVLLARAYLAAGATRVMPVARSEHSYRDADALAADLPRLLERDVIRQLRPQGGNAISADPGKGPVDQRFKVRGVRNVYVCDASVFPTAVTVAPSLAALTLAEYAATVID
jgi:hypothetical protein